MAMVQYYISKLRLATLVRAGLVFVARYREGDVFFFKPLHVEQNLFGRSNVKTDADDHAEAWKQAFGTTDAIMCKHGTGKGGALTANIEYFWPLGDRVDCYPESPLLPGSFTVKLWRIFVDPTAMSLPMDTPPEPSTHDDLPEKAMHNFLKPVLNAVKGGSSISDIPDAPQSSVGPPPSSLAPITYRAPDSSTPVTMTAWYLVGPHQEKLEQLWRDGADAEAIDREFPQVTLAHRIGCETEDKKTQEGRQSAAYVQLDVYDHRVTGAGMKEVGGNGSAAEATYRTMTSSTIPITDKLKLATQIFELWAPGVANQLGKLSLDSDDDLVGQVIMQGSYPISLGAISAGEITLTQATWDGWPHKQRVSLLLRALGASYRQTRSIFVAAVLLGKAKQVGNKSSLTLNFKLEALAPVTDSDSDISDTELMHKYAARRP